ncbi:MAG: ATP-binding protein [Kiritimatiellae bacterium]|nr:ATP-binding protein [Kiritimatiellia bacterium]
MRRLIEQELKEWSLSEERKVLLVRGARQVGKTWSIRNLGRSFEVFLEFNFEEDPSLSGFFNGRLDPHFLCERLSAYAGKSIVPGKTLLFFDEIQACPNAIRALRFFHEKMPGLHLVAAGSLLEFALEEIASFGVGRIEYRHMYPLSIREFAMAAGLEAAFDLVCRERTRQRDDALHRQLVDLTRVYMLIGGFPEVVRHYVDKRDLPGCTLLLDDLLVTLRSDFAKYRKRVPAGRLTLVLESIAAQAGGKFMYSRVADDLRSEQIRKAAELLLLAGLVCRVPHSSAQGIPLGAQANHQRFKMIPCDVGLYQRLVGMRLSHEITRDDAAVINTGPAAELTAGTELLASAPSRTRAELFYWHRESRSSNAEVDYVIQCGRDIVPVETKAGMRGTMRSLRMFLESHPSSSYGIRTSLEPFGEYGDIRVVPLYALGFVCAP